MTRKLALILAGVIILSFSACSKKQDIPIDEPVTIVWYVPGDKMPDNDMVMEAASKITMEKIGVKLDVKYIDNAAYTQRMNMNFASKNDDFDLCFTGYNNPYREAAARGAYLALDKYIEKSKLIKQAIPDYAFKTSIHNGKIFALPNMQIMATSCTGLFIQENLAQEYGLNPDDIRCLEDIEPFLEWVKNNHPEVYPFRTGAMGGGLRNSMPNSDSPASHVIVRRNADGSYKVYTQLDPEYSWEEAKLMRKWYKKGYIRSDNASVIDQTSEQAAGKFATWRGVYKPGADAEHNSYHPNNRCIAKQISEPYMTYDAGSTAMTAINAKSTHPDEAFKVMELVNTEPELINLLTYGIEGVHYNLNKDNRVVFVDKPGYKSNGGWKFGSVFNTYLVPGQSDTLWEDTIAFNDSANKSTIMGFTFNAINVRAEIGQVATVTNKYRQGQKGTADLDDWLPLYLSELKEAGIEKVAEEVEKQLNEWVLNKN